MNSIEHYAISAAIGAAIAVVVGYFAYAISFGAEGSSNFGAWLWSAFYQGSYWFYNPRPWYWAAFGALVGIGLLRLRRPLQ